MRETIIAVHKKGETGVIDFFAPLTFDFEQEGERWVGICLELGTSTFSNSLQEIREELLECVELQLNEVSRLGFTADYLQENRVRVIPAPSQADENAFALATA